MNILQVIPGCACHKSCCYSLLAQIHISTLRNCKHVMGIICKSHVILASTWCLSQVTAALICHCPVSGITLTHFVPGHGALLPWRPEKSQIYVFSLINPMYFLSLGPSCHHLRKPPCDTHRSYVNHALLAIPSISYVNPATWIMFPEI